ncbi:hypothetical protein [Bacillus sp. B15-48]|uniref:hypothetical protein n=1 Tax=Bacillus sp. B15-48 TaxID=1548601 RepID=UPI00193EDB54|nr:hypothetical protein [Bacillus sp. B15-48]MBM4763413.1 hypothetical protein [Bacillus sp. B15-48]
MLVRTIIKFGLFLLLFLGIIELTINEIFKSFSEEPEAVTAFKTDTDLLNEQIPSLEMYLVSQEKNGVEIIETYQEHEVYFDENGEVIKTVPTSNFDYLRYKEY